MNSQTTDQGKWTDELSQTFIDYGRYFVPQREYQFQIITDLIPSPYQPGTIIELCCGEGLLAQELLERFPTCALVGLDGSPLMLERARERLAQFGERFVPKLFDLADRAWREAEHPAYAVVSSMAIHHLDGTQKQMLFRDVHRMLTPGGVFVIADVVEMGHQRGRKLAAEALDEAVRQRALELDGSTEKFEFFVREGWNTFRYLDPDDIDKPSRLFDQLKWMEQAGFEGVDVHWMQAGHVVFSGWKPAASICG